MSYPGSYLLCFKMALKLARVGMAGNIQRHFGIPYLGLGIAITVAIDYSYALLSMQWPTSAIRPLSIPRFYFPHSTMIFFPLFASTV